MTFLERSYTLFPFLYFTAARPGARLLMVTDHPERMQIPFNFLGIEPVFWPARSAEKRFRQAAAAPVEFITPENFTGFRGHFDAICIDLEHSRGTGILSRVHELLAPRGSIIWLDWAASGREVWRNLPWYFGWRRGSFPRERELLSRLGRGGFSADWHFLIEPGLSKPRYLVLPGFGTDIPALSESPLKRRLLRKGFFYLQAHPQVIVASAAGSASPGAREGGLAGKAIRQLFPAVAASAAPARFLRQAYISTTGVLLLRVSNGQKTCFIRFPLTEHSLQRVQNQASLANFLHQQGAALTPRPVALHPEPALPAYVEEGISGRSMERAFTEGSREAALELFRKTQEAIRQIHQQFGRVMAFREGEFNAYIQPKLAAIEGKLPAHPQNRAAMQRIAEFLFAELRDKKMLAGLAHGDFKIGNCLFDSRGNVAGIIDWDMGSRDELALVDIASLLGRSIRQRHRLSLPGLLKSAGQPGEEFFPLCRDYFAATGTTPVNPFTTLLLYWIDRSYKQIAFDEQTDPRWLTANVYPVIERIESLI
ncbi:MAG: aminoglycoside phosphotransferase family protein [Calditrichaceae bacterium]|nr:aminoglycoside phosphotransferase family protein [Calditrichia bacterium]NUQ42077.1 aminoglycoside phosphotransferase family protein [Calditrichaceae bacterium]